MSHQTSLVLPRFFFFFIYKRNSRNNVRDIFPCVENCFENHFVNEKSYTCRLQLKTKRSCDRIQSRVDRDFSQGTRSFSGNGKNRENPFSSPNKSPWPAVCRWILSTGLYLLRRPRSLIPAFPRLHSRSLLTLAHPRWCAPRKEWEKKRREDRSIANLPSPPIGRRQRNEKRTERDRARARPQRFKAANRDYARTFSPGTPW